MSIKEEENDIILLSDDKEEEDDEALSDEEEEVDPLTEEEEVDPLSEEEEIDPLSEEEAVEDPDENVDPNNLDPDSQGGSNENDANFPVLETMVEDNPKSENLRPHPKSVKTEVYLTKSSGKTACSFCFSEINPEDGMVTRSCLHVVCLDCIKASMEQSDGGEISCPMACGGIISESEIKEMMDPEAFQLYLNKSKKKAEGGTKEEQEFTRRDEAENMLEIEIRVTDEDEGKEEEVSEGSSSNTEGHSRMPSRRGDAMILTRPAGYKELELSIPMAAPTFEAQTQVTDQEMDQEYALQRGIVLTKDNILWPTVGEYDIELASKRIQDYIDQCWTLDPKWMFCVQPVETVADDYRKRFIFEVKFSVPTALSPIPQATSSVFFIFEISHYAPKDEFVKVHYVVEGTRFLHTPGTVPFQDKWLWSIISDKVRVQRSINF